MILEALRNAAGDLPTAAIVDAVLAAGGTGKPPAMAGRVRGNLADLERRGMVLKSGRVGSKVVPRLAASFHEAADAPMHYSRYPPLDNSH
jgi:hypothetical protein